MEIIRFNCAINWPWSDRWNTLFFRNGVLPNHKAWEFNGYQTSHLVNLEFHWNRNADHAGIGFEIGLLGYDIEFQIYDTRHWDYEHDRWTIYD